MAEYKEKRKERQPAKEKVGENNVIYMFLAIILILIARERGLKNHFEAIAFAIILFVLLMGAFQYP